MHSHNTASLYALGALLLCLICLSASIIDAAEFGTSDIYTASIVAARNNVPVLLYRDAACKLCPKIEDFLVGLGAEYQTVMPPSIYDLQSSEFHLLFSHTSRSKNYSDLVSFETVIVIWQFYIGTLNKTALQLLQVTITCCIKAVHETCTSSFICFSSS